MTRTRRVQAASPTGWCTTFRQIPDTSENTSPNRKQFLIWGCKVKNDSGEIGYTGPCPPSGTHRYFAKLYALDTKLPLPSGASYNELNGAIKGHILAQAELMGTYAKQSSRVA